MKHTNLSILDRLATALAAATLAAVPFYAFLTVWGSSLVGHYTALRLAPDVGLVLLICYVCLLVGRDTELRHLLFGSLLFRLIGVYAVLTLAIGAVAVLKHDVTGKALVYGVLINLRFLAWLAVAWVLAQQSTWLQRHWKRLVFWPLGVVALFAVLQFFVLPHDFLSHFGYNKLTTIPPAQTINQNTATIRAQSTLRGPNPLGAYLVLGVGLLAAVYVAAKRRIQLGLLAVSLVALAVSFSRSAWIGAFVALAIVVYLSLKKVRSRQFFVVGFVLVLLLGGTGYALLRHSKGVQDAVLHVSSGSTAVQTSNAGHLGAFRSGLKDIVHEPFGRGPGTAGPASVYNAAHGVRDSESYYLGVGQELGWAGLLLFAAINVVVGYELWQRRTHILAVGLFAALVGLTLVNQLSYAWSDPTLAYLWWGIAGLALTLQPKEKQREIKA